MKRKITLSIALVLSLVLISMTASDSAVSAQPPQQRAVFDTGMVTLGANQALRVSIVGDWNSDGSDTIGVRFRQTEYGQQGACSSGGVCKYAVVSQNTTAPIALTAGEAASQTLVATTYGRSTVFSNSRHVRVTGAIIDTLTGATVTQIIMANTEGD